MPPELSVAAELAAIRGAGEMVHVKKVWDWLPGDIAALAGVGSDGRPLDGEDPWKFYYTVSGYRRVEDAYSLGGTFRGMPPAELSKYVFLNTSPSEQSSGRPEFTITASTNTDTSAR